MTLANKKVLITGGLGFIGSNLAIRCVAEGAEVTIFDCLDPRSGGCLYNIDSIRDQVAFHAHDILNFDQISEKVIGHDIIVNCAASTSHSFSMREPWLDQDVNSRGMINLLESIRRFNPGVRFIHLGTSTQLGPLTYQPADELHPEFPTDIYSANKSVSEKYVLIYAKAYGMRASVLRVSNVYGPRASIHSPEFTFNNFFIGLAFRDKAITVYGEGKQKRNIIYVDDVVEAIIQTAASDNCDGEVMFAVSDEHISVADIARTIVEEIGSGKAVCIPWPKGREQVEIGDAILSNAKIKALVGWKPTTGLRDGLQKTRDFYLSCLDEYLR